MRYNGHMDRIFCFPPVVDENSRVLVLGTAPSVASLAQGFYYGHPRNAFWPILQELSGARAETAEQRRELALRMGVALWDTIGSCERAGSLDAAIRDPVPNDIAALLREYPSIRLVLLNGGTALRLYERHQAGQVGIAHMALPSTSPANTIPYARKLALWESALRKGGILPSKEIR